MKIGGHELIMYTRIEIHNQQIYGETCSTSVKKTWALMKYYLEYDIVSVWKADWLFLLSLKYEFSFAPLILFQNLSYRDEYLQRFIKIVFIAAVHINKLLEAT